MPRCNQLNTQFQLSAQALYALFGEGLKNLLDTSYGCDTIDYEEALKMLEMQKRHLQAEKLHPYPIYHTEKSGWFTMVDDPLHKGGKRKIRKAHRETLIEELAIMYIDKSSKMTLSDMYEIYINWKRTPKNANNIARIEGAWKSYYLSEPLSQEIISKPMCRLTTKELREWCETLLKKHYPVDRKKFYRMFQIMSDCLALASDEDYDLIRENIWPRVKAKINPALIVPAVTPNDDTQVFSDDDRRRIKEQVYSDLVVYKNKPTSAGLQILFMFETALRIGECCGLKWSDIDGNILHIKRQANNEEVREHLKTASGRRDIPLTSEALAILEDVRRYNEEHGFNAEWIFQSNNPKYDYRLSYDSANNKLAGLCNRLGIVKKTSHKIRKTTLSTLMDSPYVNDRTVQRFAGHSDILTTQRYYNFDRHSPQQQAKAIDMALSLDKVHTE